MTGKWIENSTNNNWTLNETFIHTDKILFNITITSQIINIVVSVLTVTLNSFMIKCLQISRSNISRVIYGQLMNLCISDIIAGLTPVASCLTFIDTFNRGRKFCAALVATFHTAQYAVLSNLCALSIRRWLVLRNATKPSSGNEEQLLRSFFITLSAWLSSSVLCFTRTFLTVSDESTINGCLSPDKLANKGAVNSVIVTYGVIVVLLNIFYIYSAVILKRMGYRNSSGAGSNRQRLQKRAFMHLLAVLMVTNVTTVPTVVFPIILGLLGKKTPETMYNVTHIQALNSMINPLLYTAHITEIRTIVKLKILKICRRRDSNLQEQSDRVFDVSTTFSSSIDASSQSG